MPKFPYSNFHDLNLNWIINTLKALSGGKTGQLLRKQSNSEFDYAWETVDFVTPEEAAAAAPVQDIAGLVGHIGFELLHYSLSAQQSTTASTVTFNFPAYTPPEHCYFVGLSKVGTTSTDAAIKYYTVNNPDTAPQVQIILDNQSNSYRQLNAYTVLDFLKVKEV